MGFRQGDDCLGWQLSGRLGSNLRQIGIIGMNGEGVREAGSYLLLSKFWDFEGGQDRRDRQNLDRRKLPKSEN
jgi:hypothetical protein